MFTRSLENLDTLVHNAQVFVDAASIIFKSRRIADQIGTLLAGAYMCFYTNEISYDDAKKWITDHDFGDHTTLNSASDLDRLLGAIATRKIEISTNHQRLRITIGEAIISASGNAPIDSELEKMATDAHDELKRLGIKVDAADSVYIANRCDPMRKILEDTPWGAAWARTLSEHKGAEKTEAMYFSPGIRSRAVKLPVSLFMDNETVPV